MPGPVSDSYDPEFGTGENANAVRHAIAGVRVRHIDPVLGSELRNIVEVAMEGPRPGGQHWQLSLTENELRVIRFCLNRALDSV